MFGQTFTPNLALQLPPRGAVNWDSVINHNFSTLDLTIGRLQNPFLGAWSSSVVYFKAQQVTSGGLLYISLSDFNLANTPASSPTSWINVAVTGVSTPHAFLSATHTDTVAASPVRGDGIFAIGATPTWQRLAHSAATGGYWKWNGTDIVGSTNAAAGTGPCTNQFVSALNGDSVPTCSTVTPAFATGNTSGSGNFALTNSPTFTATTTLSGAGTNMQNDLGRAAAEVNLAIPQANGFFFTNADLAAGDFVIRQLTAGRKIYLGTGSSGASVAVTNAGLNLYTTSGTLPATIANDTTGGINLTPSGGVGWEIVSDGRLFSLPGRSINLEGQTSGIITLQVPSAAGSNVLTFPAATGNAVVDSATQTLTNKRVTPRVVTLTTSTTFTPDGDNSDLTQMNMTGVAGTLTIAAPTGTPTDAQKLILRVKTTNAQTYSFNATYRFSTTTVAPTTTGAAKTDLIGLIWNATDTKWDVVAVDQGH